MSKRTPQDVAGEHRAIKRYYDVFAPFYDDFYGLVDYEVWTGIIQQQLVELTVAPRRLLEVGCGTGSLLKQLSNHPQQICFGIDLSRPMLLKARVKLAVSRLIQGNGLALGVQSNTFEAVVGNFSLLNLYSQTSRIQMLAEIYRVLKRGGIFITDFLTIQRYHQLLKGKNTGETNPKFKIRQSLIPNQFVLQRMLTRQNCTAKERLYFLEPSEVEMQMAAANFEIIKMTPLVSDNFNRLLITGLKP